MSTALSATVAVVLVFLMVAILGWRVKYRGAPPPTLEEALRFSAVVMLVSVVLMLLPGGGGVGSTLDRPSLISQFDDLVHSDEYRQHAESLVGSLWDEWILTNDPYITVRAIDSALSIPIDVAVALETMRSRMDKTEESVARFEALIPSQAERLVTVPILQRDLEGVQQRIDALDVSLGNLRAFSSESQTQTRWIIGVMAFGMLAIVIRAFLPARKTSDGS